MKELHVALPRLLAENNRKMHLVGDEYLMKHEKGIKKFIKLKVLKGCSHDEVHQFIFIDFESLLPK